MTTYYFWKKNISLREALAYGTGFGISSATTESQLAVKKLDFSDLNYGDINQVPSWILNCLY